MKQFILLILLFIVAIFTFGCNGSGGSASTSVDNLWVYSTIEHEKITNIEYEEVGAVSFSKGFWKGIFPKAIAGSKEIACKRGTIINITGLYLLEWLPGAEMNIDVNVNCDSADQINKEFNALIVENITGLKTRSRTNTNINFDNFQWNTRIEMYSSIKRCKEYYTFYKNGTVLVEQENVWNNDNNAFVNGCHGNVLPEHSINGIPTKLQDIPREDLTFPRIFNFRIDFQGRLVFESTKEDIDSYIQKFYFDEYDNSLPDSMNPDYGSYVYAYFNLFI